ncbi:MAG: sigma-54-dependent Fis family transcriptional regulator [bacterium]|nr:sigma-54-dependent Fis family transcriptional regulator [bacterium]
MSERVLVVDDEPSLQVTLADTLKDEGLRVAVAGTVGEALSELESFQPKLVLCDLKLPDGNGIEVLKRVRGEFSDMPFVILTAHGTVATAVEAMKAGADEFLTKPFEEAQLLAVVRRYLEVIRLRRRVAELEGETQSPLGLAPRFVEAVELSRNAAGTDTNVLILGETGTGKEVIARFIHRCSPRRNKSFVAVNCAALPETLLEAELFGHEKGAFTGAIKQRRGRFEEAGGGTVFLDEVAEMAPSSQAKLLRVLQEGSFERLGSNTTIRVDVRIIAATRRDLQQEVAEGRFRDDLYYRIRVIPIDLPALRDRSEDIPLLASFFAKKYGEKLGVDLTFASNTLHCLSNHPFPGNVRELENLVHRIVALSSTDVIEPHHLPDEYASQCRPRIPIAGSVFSGTLSEMAQMFERRVLEEVLERQKGHRGRMAEALGISRKSLWQKLKSYGLGSAGE